MISAVCCDEWSAAETGEEEEKEEEEKEPQQQHTHTNSNDRDLRLAVDEIICRVITPAEQLDERRTHGWTGRVGGMETVIVTVIVIPIIAITIVIVVIIAV